MVRNIREVINKKNRKLQNTPPFFELSGWGDENRMSPVPIYIGTQRRLFYSLQPFDFFLFKFFNIISVIATMHNFSSRFLSGQNNRLLVSSFSAKLRIREFLLYSRCKRLQRAYQTQGCSRSDTSEPTEKVTHRICLPENRQMLLGYQSILRKGGYHLNPKRSFYEK